MLLWYRTGTEEENTKRGELVTEIIKIMEAESLPMIQDHGTDEDDLLLDIDPTKSVVQAEKSAADKERDKILNKECNKRS